MPNDRDTMFEPTSPAFIQLVEPDTPLADLTALHTILAPGQGLVLVETALWPGPLAHSIATLAAADARLRILCASLRTDAPRTVGEALDRAGSATAILVLAPGAHLVDQALAALGDCPKEGFAYADETGFHKPAWSIDLALEHDLSGPFVLFDNTLLQAIRDAPLSTPHDLALRCAHLARSIRHVPEALAACSGPRRHPTPHAVAAALRPLRTPSTRPDAIASTLRPGRQRIRWTATESPTMSVLIPLRDGADLLERCIDGLLQRTDQPIHQLIIADNGSIEPRTHALFARLGTNPSVTVVHLPGPFDYASINNRAAAFATGELLLLLNNDIEVRDPGWLAELAGHALRPDVGAVGARLFYPDGTIQHAGIVLGVGAFEEGPGVAGHFGYKQPGDSSGYNDQLVTTRELSAVTGACLALRRNVFERVGGLDERLPVALNDLDLCLRIRAMGLRIVWTPFATLIHHESASRGPEQEADKAARFRDECRFMRSRWAAELDADAFYNPHFSRFDHSFLPRDSGPCL